MSENAVGVARPATCDGCALAPSDSGDAPMVDRRHFISSASLAVAAALLAACMGGNSGFTTAPGSVSFSVHLSDYAALSNVGGVAMVTSGGAPFAIVRTGAAQFLTLSRICPHQGTTVGYSSGRFICPRHGAQFDESGRWIGGQPTSNMRSYSTQYDAGTGVITVG
jgi:nitrite reductase/ring-hydroxylating ferredoxin subunit